MFEKFEAVAEEKRQRVLNAALKEFAGKGYEAASTNHIAKEAGIAKGLVFHYFTSKKGLYLYLYDYVAELVLQETKRMMDLEERDLFVKLQQLAELRLSLMAKFPDIYTFFEGVYFESSPEVKQEVDERNKRLLESEYYTMFANIDRSRFREDVDVERALNVLLWTMEGLGEQFKQRSGLLGQELNIPLLMEELDQYMAILQRSFYK